MIDFDKFYQVHPTSEFYRLDDLLESSANVEVIAAGLRTCALDKVFQTKELHQGGRPTDTLPPQYMFTRDQLELMTNKTIELRDKYSDPRFIDDKVAGELVEILSSYIADLQPEIDRAPIN